MELKGAVWIRPRSGTSARPMPPSTSSATDRSTDPFLIRYTSVNSQMPSSCAARPLVFHRAPYATDTCKPSLYRAAC